MTQIPNWLTFNTGTHAMVHTKSDSFLAREVTIHIPRSSFKSLLLQMALFHRMKSARLHSNELYSPFFAFPSGLSYGQYPGLSTVFRISPMTDRSKPRRYHKVMWKPLKSPDHSENLHYHYIITVWHRTSWTKPPFKKEKKYCYMNSPLFFFSPLVPC